MRSFPIFAVALAAAIAPAVALPHGSSASYAKRAEPLTARELTNILERANSDELFVRSFGSDFVTGFKKGFTNTLSVALPFVTAFLRREDIDLLARAALIEHLDRRGEMHLLARGDTEGLYARGFGTDFIKGFKDGFMGVLNTALPWAQLIVEHSSNRARSLNELD